MSSQHNLRHLLQPMMQRMIFIHLLRLAIFLDQDSSVCVVLSIERGIDRFYMEIMRFVPVRSVRGKRTQSLFTQATTGFGSHRFGKERMIAIPLPGAVERFEKQ